MRWSPLSLLAKVLIVANILLVTAITVSGVFTYRIASESLRREIIASGTQSVQVFAKANSLDFLGEKLGESNLRLKLNTTLASDIENRIVDAFVLNAEGKVLANAKEGSAKPPGLSLLKPLDEKAEVVESTPEFITIAAPTLYADTKLGYVVFRFNKDPIREAGEQILKRAAAVIAVALAINFLLLIFMLRRVLKPVAQLGSASEAFARGDFRRRIDTRISGDEIGRAAKSFNEMADALQLHMRFSNAALVERIQRGGDDRAQEHQLSVVFGDAVGYTRWASEHTAEEIFAMLSRYYTCIGRITVRSFQGIIDKFIGDGIMMHFGMMSESRQQTSVERAYVRNALRATIYSQFALRILSYTIREFEGGNPLDYRFGLASGKCMMGAVGAKQVMLDYSIIGHVVNLASRLEGKAPAGGLLVDRFTIEDAGDGFVDIVDGGLQSVKGFERPIGVYYVQRFTEDYEMDEMRRFLVEDFLQDELIQETLLPTRNNEETRKMLRDFVVQSLDQSPTLPINPAVAPAPPPLRRSARRIIPGAR